MYLCQRRGGLDHGVYRPDRRGGLVPRRLRVVRLCLVHRAILVLRVLVVHRAGLRLPWVVHRNALRVVRHVLLVPLVRAALPLPSRVVFKPRPFRPRRPPAAVCFVPGGEPSHLFQGKPRTACAVYLKPGVEVPGGHRGRFVGELQVPTHRPPGMVRGEPRRHTSALRKQQREVILRAAAWEVGDEQPGRAAS